jgi:hypothetical protein
MKVKLFGVELVVNQQKGKFGEDQCCNGGGLPREHLTCPIAVLAKKKMSRVHLLLFEKKKSNTCC